MTALARPVCLCAAMALLLGASACKSKDITGQDILAKYKETPATRLALVAGYNEPQAFQKGIGLRAVGDGGRLYISVRNDTKESITLGPASFRMVLPDGLYAFEEPKNDLRGFPVKTVYPDGREVFAVACSDLDNVVNNALVLNYPPQGVILRTFIEPLPKSSSPAAANATPAAPATK